MGTFSRLKHMVDPFYYNSLLVSTVLNMIRQASFQIQTYSLIRLSLMIPTMHDTSIPISFDEFKLTPIITPFELIYHSHPFELYHMIPLHLPIQ